MLRFWVSLALAMMIVFSIAAMLLSRVWESTGEMDSNWQIIFTNFDLRYGQVAQVMNLDGSDIQPLNLHLMPVTYPDCSPSGNQFAFVAGNHLYTALANGENRRRFDPRTIPNLSGLSISDTGSTVLFNGRLESNFGIYLINIETAQELKLTDIVPQEGGRYGNGHDLSPEGGFITYYTPEQYKFYVLRTDGTEVMELPGQAPDGVWSPDGNMVAFAANWDGNFDIYIMDVNRFIIRQVTHLDGDSGYRFPSWSPDGRHLAFLVYGGLDVGGEIYVMNMDGSGQRLLTDPAVKAETACFLTARPTSLIANP